MNLLLFEGGDYSGIIILILAIMFGPSILFAIIGFVVRKNNKKAAKVLFIIAAVYAIISLGICGSLIAMN